MFRKTLSIMLLLVSEAVVAWSGIDNQTRTPVEVPKGQLVRPGLEFQFYDGSYNNFRRVRAISMESDQQYIYLWVADIELGRKRLFIMQREQPRRNPIAGGYATDQQIQRQTQGMRQRETDSFLRDRQIMQMLQNR